MQCKTIPSQENSSRRSGSAWCGRKRAPPPSRNTCGMRRILPPGWTAGRRPRRRRGLEGRLAGGEAGAGHHQRQAGGGQPVPCISGLAGVSGEAPAHPAAAVPGRQPGADKAGVPPPAGDRPHPGPGTAGAAAGNHLRHRNPGVRGALCHRGGRVPGKGPKSP